MQGKKTTYVRHVRNKELQNIRKKVPLKIDKTLFLCFVQNRNLPFSAITIENQLYGKWKKR